MLHLKGILVTLLAVYLVAGVGLSGRNRELFEMACLLATWLSGPVVVICGFILPPLKIPEAFPPPSMELVLHWQLINTCMY